jgi:hypothetical protein
MGGHYHFPAAADPPAGVFNQRAEAGGDRDG